MAKKESIKAVKTPEVKPAPKKRGRPRKIKVEGEKATLEIKKDVEKKEIILDTEKVDITFKKDDLVTEVTIKTESGLLKKVFSFISRILKKK